MATRISEQPTQPSFRHSDAGTSEAVWAEHLADTPMVHLGDLGVVRRAVVVAPHPDDESLGAGGLVSSWNAAGVDVTVVVCTDGEAADGGLDRHDRRRLAARRAAELTSAIAELSSGPLIRVVRLALPDGELEIHGDELVDRLRPLVAGADVVVGPWPGDGHPDHETVGRAVRTAAGPTPRLEYPVWAWHWGAPADLDDGTVVRIPLSPSARRAKTAAIRCHESQSGGDDPILTPDVLAHFDRPEECFVVDDDTLAGLERVGRSSSEFFEALYSSAPSGDPWDFDRSPDEQQRLDRVVEALGPGRFDRCLEIGCSTGQLTRRLADRATTVVAIDTSASAIDVARRTCAGLPGVDLRVGHVPDDLRTVEGVFDLIVVSDVGYYFSEDELDALIGELVDRAAPTATLLAAHWLGGSPDHVLDAATTHHVIADALDWHHTSATRSSTHQFDRWTRP